MWAVFDHLLDKMYFDSGVGLHCNFFKWLWKLPTFQLKNVTNVTGEQLKNYWSFIQDLSIKKNNIDFVKFSPASIAPTQGTDYSAGFDL